MKLPNGYGTVYRLSGNRRRPFVVKKTIGGKQKPLGYFESYQKAFEYLVELNHCTSSHDVTFSAVYYGWKVRHFEKIGKSSQSAYGISYRHLSALHAMPFTSITYPDLQRAVDSIEAGYCTRKKCRVLLSQLYKYAIKNGIVDHDFSPFIELPKHIVVHKKKPFNTRQINRVKAIADDDSHPLSRWAKCVIMMCYSGPRPSEFINILASDVKLRSRTYKIRHSKTKAGQNRLVPISKKVLPYYVWWAKQGGKTLIVDDSGQPMTYCQFRRRFDKVMDAARCHHTPHECRHTCATWLDDKGANKIAIKRILGHAVQDITDGIYTHKNIRQLKKAIDLL